MVEAHARAVAASVVPRATKGIPGRTMDMITQELLFVLEGSDGAAERCAAMESLFWLQVRKLYTLSFLGVHCFLHPGRYSVYFFGCTCWFCVVKQAKVNCSHA